MFNKMPAESGAGKSGDTSTGLPDVDSE